MIEARELLCLFVVEGPACRSFIKTTESGPFTLAVLIINDDVWCPCQLANLRVDFASSCLQVVVLHVNFNWIVFYCGVLRCDVVYFSECTVAQRIAVAYMTYETRACEIRAYETRTYEARAYETRPSPYIRLNSHPCSAECARMSI